MSPRMRAPVLVESAVKGEDVEWGFCDQVEGRQEQIFFTSRGFDVSSIMAYTNETLRGIGMPSVSQSDVMQP